MESTLDKSNALDQTILEKGSALWKEMGKKTPGLFNKDYWQGRIMEWVMKDPDFKVDMFRFVDVIPALDNADIPGHIKQYLLKEGRELPGLIKTALLAATTGITKGIGAKTMRKNITDMAKQFIVGEDAKRALPVLKKLYKEGFGFTVDLLGEATISAVEADIYQDRYSDLIENLSKVVSTWEKDPLLSQNHLGEIPLTNVSIKVSALTSHINVVDPQGSVERLKKRVLPLLLKAKENQVFINFDLEQWEYHDITYTLFEEVLQHPELKTWPHIGIVVQAYLKSALEDAERLKSLAEKRGAPITIRLVKGAYWDYEIVIAQQNGWEAPVFQRKEESDAHFEQLSLYLLDNINYLLPAFGSHNVRSLVHAFAAAEQRGIPKEAYEIQSLYGMAEPMRQSLREQGYRVRVYAPVGELLPGMAYLVRRLLENTSNSGFLSQAYQQNADMHQMLKDPHSIPPAPVTELKGGYLHLVPNDLSSPFENCALTDFTCKEEYEQFAAAVEEIKTQLPLRPEICIDGKTEPTTDSLSRVSPCDNEIEVTQAPLASREQAERAIEIATKRWPDWRDTPLRERAQLLENLANILQRDRYELAALQTYEEGKAWKEADGDVAEAIDFCRYYARQALTELGPRQQGSLPGEDNTLFYEGRGPSVIISPWNFPLAILCGMATASLVAGNTIIMKPAGLSAGVAYQLHQRMLEAGIPGYATHYLPGKGSEIGSLLVEHKDIAQIAFTGSRQVGCEILEKAAKVHPGQRQVKRVVCEMGGKNAIIVDSDADLDQAVVGVVKSAFGYSGQKCSACSRLIAVGNVFDNLLERLREATSDILVAPAYHPSCDMGPVIDASAYTTIMDVINNPGKGAELLYQMTLKDLPQGQYVPPTIFLVKDPQHRLLQEEFFAPILTVIHVNTFAEALEVATNTEYALTGGVFTRSPDNLKKAQQAFRVGNLYLNRGCTGALVHRQPFGGAYMSGGGTKAGGPNYLLNFADPRSITENTMRQGFTPEISQ